MSQKRSCGSNCRGRSFSEQEKSAVWRKATVIPGYEPRIWRRDTCGASMKWSEYGNTTSNFGWEIDHIKPVAAGGGDDLSNLQALQWANNRYKSDDWPAWSCKTK